MKRQVTSIYRVKNEARWIGESLERTLRVADRVVVFDDHSDDDTTTIARNFNPKRVSVIESPYATFDEARDKAFLLRTAMSAGAEWIICLDGDEVFTRVALQEVRDIVTINSPGMYFFRVAYLWDVPTQERCDGVYDYILAPRMFSMFDQQLAEITYRTTQHGGNLHCGSLPDGYKGRRRDLPSAIKHYGYLYAEDRERKHAWYNATDTPQGRRNEGDYNHIIGQPSPWAPGPLKFRPFID